MPITKFYPRGYNPIHEVRDWCYVRSIIRAARRGETIPPFVVDGDNMLSGTHRCAANNLMEMLYNAREKSPKPALIEAVQLSDLDLADDTREAIEEAIQFGVYDDLDRLLAPVEKSVVTK